MLWASMLPDIWGNMGNAPLMLRSRGLARAPEELLEGPCFFCVRVTKRGVGLLPTYTPADKSQGRGWDWP